MYVNDPEAILGTVKKNAEIRPGVFRFAGPPFAFTFVSRRKEGEAKKAEDRATKANSPLGKGRRERKSKLLKMATIKKQ